MRSRILFTLCFVSVVLGQPSFTAADIATSADGAQSVYAIDLDSDGDIDVLTDYVWFKNDGSENFTDTTIQAD